ncbi:MAG: hypothetical protein E7585_01035 [Ruminococcaceae bacterium]|nr:hypothetical protein [Oscillospiraceae bacterium]
MKKLVSLLLAICMCFSVGVMLTACGHEHTYQTEWSKDATHHWHACTDETCAEQLDKAEHAYSNGACVCGAQDPDAGVQQGLTKADYVEVYSKVINEVDAYVSSASPMRVSPMRATVSDSDFENVSPEQGKNAISGNIAMLYFLRNLCNTPAFEITDGFQDIIVVDNVSSSNAQTFKIRINMSYDSQTGIIQSSVYVEDHTTSNISVYSLEFEFDYDFETETLSGFTVLGVMGAKEGLSASGVNYLKYSNGNLQRIKTSSQVFEQFAADVLQECAQIGATQFAHNLTDYSTQYINAMQEAFS